jgi:hypothetical protein
MKKGIPQDTQELYQGQGHLQGIPWLGQNLFQVLVQAEQMRLK